MTIFVEDKLKPSRVGQRLADASDIESTGSTTVQSEIDALKLGTNQPVAAGQSFRFNDASAVYDGLVFQSRVHANVISFSDDTLDIPGVPSGVFHAVGLYVALQYPQGIVYARVTSSTSTGGRWRH